MNTRQKYDEFYVGYLPKAPAFTAKFIRWVILVLALACAVVCGVIVFYQSPFSTSNFEYGKYTEIQGDFFSEPVPHLRVNYGKTQDGFQIIKTVPLVATGKHGFENIFQNLLTLDGKHISAKGFLIYGDGKSLLQVNQVEDVRVNGESIERKKIKVSTAEVELLGEVVDPKCYFGVMKPGEGKPHRSCAIRCIAGGIPAVFHQSGTSNYYLLVDENGKTVNEKVLGIVGDVTNLRGQVITFDDWSVLQLNRTTLMKLANINSSRQELSDQVTICSTH